MSTTGVYAEAEALARNLATGWTGGQAVLDRLVEASGSPVCSPAAAIRELGPEGVETVFDSPEKRDELHAAFTRLTAYGAAQTWYERVSSDNARLAELTRRPVAYLCMEYGLTHWLQIYSGGLGVLAGDMLKEASDMGLPLVSVGLMYRQGFFHQKLDPSGYQTEYYEVLDPAFLGLSLVLDGGESPLSIAVPIAERSVRAHVWQMQVGRVPLYLLDTDIDENERDEDREISRNLYGGDHDMRIKQEILLGIGGVRTLRALGIEPGVYSMNEGHSAFLGLELLADALHDTDFSTALQGIRPKMVYTNHTVVPAGNDVFSAELVRHYLGPYARDRGIGEERLLGLATDQHGGFSMAILAFQMSGKANAVSQLHAKVIPREWPGYAVEAVTNGVHAATWTGPHVQALLDRYVPDWRGDDPDWGAIKNIPDSELLAARDAQRRDMVSHLSTLPGTEVLSPDALTIVWARRFAEYKRAFLMASDLDRLARLLSDEERPVQIVISGKAHPRDEGGKRVLQDLLGRLRANGNTAAHVTFVEDYNVQIARYLVWGADVWLNTPRKPLEASGTSGMKSSDNGGLQLTVTDGWADEVDWWGVGWGITGADDVADAQQLYWYLEESVVPSFYRRNDEVASGWASMMKNTMIVTLSRYSGRRMLLDYVNKLYLPLLEEQSVIASVAG